MHYIIGYWKLWTNLAHVDTKKSFNWVHEQIWSNMQKICTSAFGKMQQWKLNLYAIGQVGLKGEALNLHTESGSSSVEWIQGSLVAKKQPLTWYKVRINFQQMLHFCQCYRSFASICIIISCLNVLNVFRQLLVHQLAMTHWL